MLPPPLPSQDPATAHNTDVLISDIRPDTRDLPTNDQSLMTVLQRLTGTITQIESRLASVEKQSTPTNQSGDQAAAHTVAEWMSNLPEVPMRPAPPAPYGDVSKFKPDVSFNGFGMFESFLFALRQSIAAYNLHTERQKAFDIRTKLERRGSRLVVA